MYAFLYGIEIPTQDGEPLGTTYYSERDCGVRCAAEALRKRLDGMRAVHSFAYHSARRASAAKLSVISIFVPPRSARRAE